MKDNTHSCKTLVIVIVLPPSKCRGFWTEWLSVTAEWTVSEILPLAGVGWSSLVNVLLAYPGFFFSTLTITKYWTQFPCQSTSATYFQIILNITSVRTDRHALEFLFYLKLLLDFHFKGSQWAMGLFEKCSLPFLVLAGCCCSRNSVLEGNTSKEQRKTT